MRKPTFSIIIPTLNEEKFLPRLLESLVQQTDKDYEVVVVDGPSKDKTKNIALSYKRKMPLTLVSSVQGNLPLQRNLGAAKARGQWFVFVDADSVLLPYFVARSKAFIGTKAPQLFTTWCSPDSDVNGDALITLLINIFWDGSVMFKRQLAPGPLTAMTRDVFARVGGYDEDIKWGEDYDIAHRLDQMGVKLHIIRETLFIVSLRRFRKEGNLRALQIYATGALLTLITKHPPTHMPGYIMGGHFYGTKKKPVRTSLLRRTEEKLVNLMKELFE